MSFERSAARAAAALSVAWLGAVVQAPAHAQATQAAPASAPAKGLLPLADPQTSAFVDGLLKAWYAPTARRFAADGDALADRTQAWCSSAAKAATPATRDPALDAARQAWVLAMASWTRLSAVQVGPLLDRHSDTRLDFQPMRPAALDKVIASPASPGEWAMDRVGAQARGLPAMEYLLWKKPAAPRTPACAYLVVLARDLRDEGRELALAYAGDTAATRTPEQAAEWFNTYVNQWLAGMARLRWRDLEMPVRSWGMDQAPRAASGQTALAWRERWQALRWVSLGGADRPAGLLPLADYLKARGLAAEAATMARDIAAVDSGLQDASPATPGPQLLDTAKRVDTITHTMSRDVPAALQVQLEFSAEDGD
ncbi:MAG: imelysin family protein [Burkholderiaceae bacterium]